jgi:hypothetical protein
LKREFQRSQSVSESSLPSLSGASSPTPSSAESDKANGVGFAKGSVPKVACHSVAASLSASLQSVSPRAGRLSVLYPKRRVSAGETPRRLTSFPSPISPTVSPALGFPQSCSPPVSSSQSPAKSSLCVDSTTTVKEGRITSQQPFQIPKLVLPSEDATQVPVTTSGIYSPISPAPVTSPLPVSPVSHADPLEPFLLPSVSSEAVCSALTHSPSLTNRCEGSQRSPAWLAGKAMAVQSGGTKKPSLTLAVGAGPSKTLCWLGACLVCGVGVAAASVYPSHHHRHKASTLFIFHFYTLISLVCS